MKVTCPSCDGTGRVSASPITCECECWLCKGDGEVSEAWAKRNYG